MKHNKNSINLFVDFFNNSSMSMIILGENGIIEYFNSSFRKMVGISKKENIKNNIIDFIYSKDRNKFSKSFNELISGKINTFNIEIRYIFNNDLIKWWNLKISSTSDNGKDRFIFGIMDDITPNKTETDKLKLQKKYAQNVTKMKSDFLANMSHEIRTPIHTIIGMNELLLETRLDEEQKEYAEQIKFSAEVLLSLINDILDFSKIEAGKLRLEYIGFELDKLVEEAVNLAVLEAHKKGLEVCMYIDNNIPNYLVGDPVRLRQIITNFFNNAVKFTGKGEIVVSVELIDQDETTANVTFSVTDTGIGIPENKLEKLFKSFTQIDTSVTRVYGGTGLGLSISKNLVKLMKGEIGVTSKVNSGSTFWYRVRLKKQIGNIIHSKLGNDFGENIEVLIVDDNAQTRKITRKYLENIGCSVTEAESGFKAIELINERNKKSKYFHLCFIDLLMPGMDGWQLASILNDNSITKNSKLILLSPLGKSADEAKMKLLNWFSFYLAKPIKRSDIFKVISWYKNSDINIEGVEELSSIIDEEEKLKKNGDSHYKVLVAEDHEINQKLFKTVLENLGYDVIVVNNGIDAIQASNYVDLIFMDVNMPQLDGISATLKIRENGLRTPIIAITASVINSDRTKCIDAGMNDLLTKPFKKKDIIPILNRWLHDEKVNERYQKIEDENESKFNLDNSIIDFDKAVNNFMGNKDVVIESIKVFMQKIPEQLSAIENALEKNDFKTIKDEAHSIKSSALNLEIAEIGENARELELSAYEGLKDQSKKYLGLINKNFEKFKVIARNIINNIK